MEINGEIVNDKVRYADLNLSPELMRAIDKKGYVQATPGSRRGPSPTSWSGRT